MVAASLASRLENLPIRTRTILLVLAVMLPVGVLLGGVLAGELRRAEATAAERVGTLATGSAADLQRTLHQVEAMARLSARPLLRALDPAGCDPLVDEFLQLNPAFAGFAVLDAQGRVACRFASTSRRAPMPDGAEASAAAAANAGVLAGPVFVDERSGRKLATLGFALRDGERAAAGRLLITVDLLALNAQLLAGTPKDAVVAVVDRTRTIVLRSVDPEAFIGTRPGAREPSAPRLARGGTFTATGRDGVRRLFADVTLPGVGWHVAAGLPEAEVYATYRGAIWRICGFALGVCLLAFTLAWRLSAAIVEPIARLQRAAGEVAAGQHAVRAELAGPPEIRAVAKQFNHMLEARADSDARLRGILESVVDAVITANEQQVVVQANAAAASMFLCPLAAMVGAPLAHFIPERHRQDYAQNIRAFGSRTVAPRRAGLRREATVVRADGVEFPVEASLSNVSIGGAPLFTVILRDITERRRIEQALRDGASKLEAALSSMSDAVCISDVEGRLIEFNLAFASFHGFSDKAACGTTPAQYAAFLDMAMPDGRIAAPSQWPLARALRGEAASNCEYRLRRRNAARAWIGSYSFAPIRSGSGEIVGAVVAARDVSAIRAVQADLESSHVALQRLIASRDQVQEEERVRIARELHDDLQQTLAAIRMNLRAIRERFGSEAPGLVEPVEVVDGLAEQAVASTRRIVNDLRPPMLEDLGLLPALELLASQFAQQHGIACRIDAPSGISDALADRPEVAICLYRIAQEALNNVVKHARAGKVRILLVAEPSAAISLHVSDDGVGMDATDRRKPESFGILGIQERVRSHGGLLRIDSRPGAGTRLEVQLPLAPEPQAIARQAGAAHPGFGALEDGGDERLDDAHSLPRLLSRTTQRALQDAIDALAGNVAILDARGVIRFVNRAWTEFAVRNGHRDPASAGPGANYLACIREDATAEGAEIARGLGELLHGSRASFSSTYACHSPDELRWFQMNATPMANGDVMVEHVLIRHEMRGHRVAHDTHDARDAQDA